MNNYLQQKWLFWQYVLKRFFTNNVTYQAAALTYASLLAIVPLITVILKIVSLLPFFQSMMMQAQSFFYENFTVIKGSTLHNYLQNFTEQASHLPMLGSIFLVVMVVMVLVTLEKIFNSIWEVKPEPFTIKSLLLYWAGLLIPISILLSALFIVSILLSFPLLEYHIPFVSIQLLAFLPFILTTLGLSALYYFVPDCKVKLTHALLSGLLATTLLTLTKNLLAWYIMDFSVYELIYGAFAIIPIILLWFYVIWVITLFGAEVCHALGYYRGKQ